MYVFVYPEQTLPGLQETRGSGGDPTATDAGESTVTAERGPKERD